MFSRSRLIPLIAGFLLLACFGCKSSGQSQDDGIKENEAPGSAIFERFSCAENMRACAGIASYCAFGNCVLLTAEESWSWLDELCARNTFACYSRVAYVTAKLRGHETRVKYEGEVAFSSASGMEREAALAWVKEQRIELVKASEGACGRKDPVGCSIYVSTRWPTYPASEVSVAEADARASVIETLEEMCGDVSLQERDQACHVAIPRLRGEGASEERIAKLEAEYQAALHESCTTPPYNPSRCNWSEKSTDYMLALCKGGDESACFSHIDGVATGMDGVTSGIAFYRSLLASSLEVEQLPEDLDELTPEQKELGKRSLDSIARYEASLIELGGKWREAHRPGCAEQKIEEICASWKAACQDAAVSVGCDGAPGR